MNIIFYNEANINNIYIRVKLSIFILFLLNINSFFNLNIQDPPINLFKRFVNYCRNLRNFNYNEEKLSSFPFISICISVYNAEKYIASSILSILNQSFQNFEIIIVNDNSSDLSESIIKAFQINKPNIKLINHQSNMGIYASRVDSILNSIGKYILFLDPDDLYLNPYLFESLYKLNKESNLDITEFLLYYSNENENEFYIPNHHSRHHNHNFTKKVIVQPELSNILFYKPNSFTLTNVYCRNIWNKMVKRNILINTINFIGIENYHQLYFNFAEDTIMNIINFQFASNYTNIMVYGYLYNKRNESASYTETKRKEKKLIINYNIILYYIIFNKYIEYFKKNKKYIKEELKFILKYFFFYRRI